MPLMPKRVKWRKSQRGTIKGVATRGNTLAFGDFGVQSLDRGWINGHLPAERLGQWGPCGRSAAPHDRTECAHDEPFRRRHDTGVLRVQI